MTIRRALVQMMLARQVSVVVMAVALVALGRLLTPAEFGIFATMLAIVGLLEVVVRFGIAPQLIRRPKMTVADLRAGQGLALALGCGAAVLLLVVVALLPAERWPADGRAVLTILAVSLPFLTVLETLEIPFHRDLQVRTVAQLGVVRQVAESAISVALAALGMGAVALAIGVLTHRVVGAATLAWVARGSHGFRPIRTGWAPFGRFARDYLGMDLAAKAGDAGVVLVIQRMLGLDMLGQFNRAKRVIGLLDDTLLTGVQPVILPALSRSLEAGVGRDRAYLVKVEHLAGLCWPAFAFIALMAEEIVLLMLGQQWGETVSAVRILALAGLVLPITKMSVGVFVALDAAAIYTRIQTVHQVMRVGFVAAGAMVSLDLACLGAALSSYLKAGAISVSLKRRTGYGGRAMASVAWRAALVTLGTLAGPLAIKLLAPGWSAPALLAAATLLSILGWIGGALVARHALLPEALAAFGATGLAERARHKEAG